MRVSRWANLLPVSEAASVWFFIPVEKAEHGRLKPTTPGALGEALGI